MILIIDDNRDLANLFCQYLNMQGYEAIATNSGEEALVLAKEWKPSAILCDIAMGGMDGYEVAKKIRADQELKNVHLFAISGYCSQADVDRSLAAGFDQHLCKPVDLQNLKRMLDEL